MEQNLVIGLIGLVGLFGLIAIRMPIAYAMILVGGIGVSYLNGPGILLSQLKDLTWAQFSVYDLSVVPLFILMGAIASRAGFSRDLFRAANAWMGWVRGGVAMSAVTACAGFGAICGSSLATASTMATVALPELRRYKYSGALATGTLAAGGVLGILIPPSVVLIIYAIIVEASVVDMFAAALIPGIMATLFFIFTVAIYVAIKPETGPPGSRPSRQEFIEATLGILPVAILFLMVIGGIYLGFFNPTPAAAVGVFLVTIFGFMRQTISLSKIRDSLFDTAKTTGMIYLILLGAEMLKIFMTRSGVPQSFAGFMANSDLAPMLVLILLLFALIVLGCLMDSLSMILLVTPFFWPVIVEINGGDYVTAQDAAFGLGAEDLKIWFGILALIVVELGLITPPVGLNVFIISSHAPDVSMLETFKGVAPFFGAEILRISLIIIFPAIALWLPGILT
ncbi:MAG: TRAP transporter large permease [Gammaproteobacteria bacterium]|nr:TRAP transporter large permease [Gammaproteobacteria bacterium]MDH3535879.1 TRAP transporter large permease [Gammaproteobacteria bacterium]